MITLHFGDVFIVADEVALDAAEGGDEEVDVVLDLAAVVEEELDDPGEMELDALGAFHLSSNELEDAGEVVEWQVLCHQVDVCCWHCLEDLSDDLLFIELETHL